MLCPLVKITKGQLQQKKQHLPTYFLRQFYNNKMLVLLVFILIGLNTHPLSNKMQLLPMMDKALCIVVLEREGQQSMWGNARLEAEFTK